MSLNPGVVEKIVFDSRTLLVSDLKDPQFVFEEPRDIRPIIVTMLECTPYTGPLNRRQSGVWMEIVRPYGQNFRMKLLRDHQSGRGLAIMTLYVPYFGLHVPVGVYASEQLDEYFVRNMNEFIFWRMEKKK